MAGLGGGDALNSGTARRAQNATIKKLRQYLTCYALSMNVGNYAVAKDGAFGGLLLKNG